MALYVERQGTGESRFPALVLMHFLGGSGREWDEVVAALGPAYRTLRVDLPGFGGSAKETGYTLAEMTNAVAAVIADLDDYVLVGHSMSGTVAMLLARQAADAGDKRLKGLVLVAPSPPGPEPMEEEKRGAMLASLGGAPAAEDFDRALNYINKNETRDMPPEVEARAAHEVMRMNRTAWVAWLTHGSKEDWREQIGLLPLPAVLVAGEKDTGLGPDVQRELTLPALADARSVLVVKGCGHLVPMERPGEMAAILRDFCARILRGTVPAEYMQFLASDRVSVPTRTVLERRIAGPGAHEGVLDDAQQRILRALVERVVPGSGLDLAGYVMAQLASGEGDGWRYAVLPRDVQAWREGLDRLHEQGFAEMTIEEQDERIEKMAAGKGTIEARWFEEVRGAVTEAYAGHPATLARWGYSGFGVGGAFTPHRGFVELGVNQREPWEPVALATLEVTR